MAVLEPLLIGRATSLRPIVMLLSIMIYGSIWCMACARNSPHAWHVHASPLARMHVHRHRAWHLHGRMQANAQAACTTLPSHRGMVGMIMAVPMTAVLRIILRNIEHPLSRNCADLLGGKQSRSRTLSSDGQRSYKML